MLMLAKRQFNSGKNAAATLVWKAARTAMAIAASKHGYPHQTDAEIYATAFRIGHEYPESDSCRLLRLDSIYPSDDYPAQAVPNDEWEADDFIAHIVFIHDITTTISAPTPPTVKPTLSAREPSFATP